MNLFTLIGTRIDRWVLPLASRHALSVLKREYGCMEAHQILWRAWDEFGRLTRRGPAYGMRQLSFPDGRVSLDAHRCPVIAYYEDLGIPHLCRSLVCDLDFALAREWDADLTREYSDRKDCEEVQP